MDLTETAQTLTLIAQLDPRFKLATETFDLVNDLWQQILADCDAPDVLAAVAAHYHDTRERIMPADIVEYVDGLIADRLRAVPPVGELMGDLSPFTMSTREYTRILRERRNAILHPHRTGRPEIGQ